MFTEALTLVRTRGRFDFSLSSYTSAGDGYQGAVAIGLASLPAFTAGIGSLPTPISEMGWDGWLWHSIVGIHSALAAGATAVGQIASISLEVDSKAMRKLTDQMVIFAAIEVVELGTASLNVFFDSRMLFKS